MTKDSPQFTWRTPLDADIDALDKRKESGEELPRHWHLSDRGLYSVRREGYQQCQADMLAFIKGYVETGASIEKLEWAMEQVL